MVDSAIVWLLTIISLLIGYWIGAKKPIEQPLEQLKTMLKPKETPQKIGGVHKLSPIELAKKGSTLEETEKAMIETYNKEMK